MTEYDKIEAIKNVILEILEKCGISAQVEFEESITKGLIYNISSPDSQLLIGRRGATLHSLQILVQSLVTKRLSGSGPVRFSLDVDDYKRKREWFLKETAKAAVEHIKRTGRATALEPMPSYERRYIHAYLSENFPEVSTESIGRDPYRKIVIRLK